MTTLDHIIVHRLQKQREQTSRLDLRPAELAVSPAAEHLLQYVLDTYDKRTGKGYGTFETDRRAHPFSGYFDDYLGGKIDFAPFTHESMQHFKKKIDLADWATGGYVVFLLYRADGASSAAQHLIVAMLNDQRGTAVDATTLEIRDITHLVLDELHQAVEIDVAAWRAGKTPYLSFVKGRRSATVSQYFRTFLGCAEYVDPVTESRKLVGMLRSFTKDLSKPVARRARQVAFDTAVEAHTHEQPLDLEELSQRIDPDRPKAFLEHANTKGMSGSFEPDIPVLRRLNRFYGSDAELSIGFDGGLLGNRVQFDPETKSLTIVRLPKGLERQLERAV